MIIEEADFRMESIGDNLHFWDLSVLKLLNPRTENVRSLKLLVMDFPYLHVFKE